MAIDIRIPKLGLTMLDATLANWMIGTGQPLVVEQAVCVIETDKLSYEIPSPGVGLLMPIVEVGRRMEVGQLIGFVAADEAELNALKEQYAVVDTAVQTTVVEDPGATKRETKPGARSLSTPGERIKSSPLARFLSKQHGVDLTTLSGSGPGGRIIKSDVLNVIERSETEKSSTTFGFELDTGEPDVLNAVEEIPIRGIRKLIFQNMRLSLSQQAQLTIHTEASARAMVDLRQLLHGRLEAGSSPVSYNAILVKAVAQSLRQHPRLNATVDGRVIKVWKQIHIGVAMDFGQGLLVPKVRRADRKSIRDISQEINNFVERSREKKLLPDELQNGTFTITNLGAWGTDYFTPIVNFPESAILGVGRIVEKPWVRDGSVVVEPRISLSLTFDHRIIDGSAAAAFLKTIKDMLEEPGLML